MSVYIGDVQTFAGVIADKPQALKVIEESAEVFSAWERLRVFDSDEVKGRLVEEIADTIQACANLLAAIGVDDMRQPMQVCYVRNKERGREYSSSDDSADAQQDSIRTRPISNGTCPIDEPQSMDVSDSREQLEADVSKWCLSHAYGDTGYTFIIKQLDRQAAITAIEVARERYDIERDLTAARDELQEALNAAAGKWAKADARCSELKAENEALKTKVETLRSKLSKMLDAASTIQHIGDLP